MNDSLLNILVDKEERQRRASRLFGVAIGIVTNNKDPQGMGRVKVRFPWLSDANESYWARVATPMAGNDRGTFFLPETGDEVLVAFQHGDVHFPHVVGSLWNGQDRPPEANVDGQNNIRVVKSRSGHTIRLDDTTGSEKIEIIDGSGQNKVVIESTGKISIEGMNIEIKAKGDLRIEGIKVEVRSDTTMDLKAGATMTVQGAIVKIN